MDNTLRAECPQSRLKSQLLTCFSRQNPVNSLSIVLLIVLPWLVFWRLWAPNSGDRMVLIGDVLSAYPTRVLVHQFLQSGYAPLWNPFQLSGMPLLADVQVAVYYIPNLLLDFLTWGNELTLPAFEALVIGHFAIGGVLMYGYLRNLGLKPATALVGAVAFEFNGFFIGHHGHYSMLSVVVWLPGILWGFDRARLAKTTWAGIGWAVVDALFLSQMVMAGHPQLAYYCTLFILAYFIYRWSANWGAREIWLSADWKTRMYHPLTQTAIRFGITGVLAAGLSAVMLLPTAELLGRSLRSEPNYAFTAQYALSPRDLMNLLIPEFLNWSGTEFRIYAGILTLVLSVVTWTVPEQARRERAFFSATAVIALVVALGAFTSVHGILYRLLPGYSSSRVTARAFYFANFALAVLAAMGAETLSGHRSDTESGRLRRIIKAGSVLLLSTGLLIGGLYILLALNYRPVGDAFYFYESQLPLNNVGSEDRFVFLTHITNNTMLFALFLLGSVAVLWLCNRNRLHGRRLVLVLALLITLDVTTFAPYHDTSWADPRSETFHVTGLNVTALEPWQSWDFDQLLAYLTELPDDVRVDNTTEVLSQNYGQLWGIPVSTGYNVLDLKERAEMFTIWPTLSDTLKWDLMNVGYVLTPSDDDVAPEEGAQLVLANSQGKVWERSPQPEYAHFSSRIRSVQDSMAINGLLALAGTGYDHPTISATEGDLHTYLSQTWPETIDGIRYRIGETGVRSPVDISVLAGGTSGYSAVIVDGVSVTPDRRGIVLATIDPLSGEVLQRDVFDTYQSSQESDRLAATIGAARSGDIVALATYDEGTAALTDAARSALTDLGAQETLQDVFGQAYALIGVKGSAVGTAVERLSPEPQAIDVGIGAYPGEAEATFSASLLKYRPEEIVLQVDTTTTGLVTISESVYPGWRAWVDGAPTPILRANGIFRAVVVPAGSHEVAFIFDPLSFRLGSAVSLLSAALSVGVLAAAGIATRKEGKNGSR